MIALAATIDEAGVKQGGRKVFGRMSRGFRFIASILLACFDIRPSLYCYRI